MLWHVCFPIIKSPYLWWILCSVKCKSTRGSSNLSLFLCWRGMNNSQCRMSIFRNLSKRFKFFSSFNSEFKLFVDFTEICLDILRFWRLYALIVHRESHRLLRSASGRRFRSLHSDLQCNI